MVDPTEHQLAARLHQAPTSTKLGQDLFRLIGPRLANELIFIAFLPIKFEIPALSSVPKYQAACNRYIRDLNKQDIWLRRSPIGPHVQVVRHSDYTPLHLLRRSTFYRDTMRTINSEHGASMTAWQGKTWLATLTVFRNAAQGDFTDEDMTRLLGWQAHFETAVRRLAREKEEKLDDDSLATFIWNLPSSALILDWDLTPRHHNVAAATLCRVWRQGPKALARKGGQERLQVPREILEAIPRLKPRIEAAKLARPGPRRAVEFLILHHPSVEGLSARICFIPSKSLSLSRGRFLIELHYNRSAEGSSSVYEQLTKLSRSEREAALYAAKGLTNVEIGRTLKKSPGTVKLQLSQVFRKLGLRSRTQLAHVLSPLTAGVTAAASMGQQILGILP